MGCAGGSTFIGDEIEAAQRGGTSLNETAVLVRTASMMRTIEERFIEIGLPYKVFGGPRFYERKEIRDAIAYLRLIAQPSDDLHLSGSLMSQAWYR